MIPGINTSSNQSSLPGDDPARKNVDYSAPPEPICNSDADAELAQADIDHLCRVWAGVGRAILLRRSS